MRRVLIFLLCLGLLTACHTMRFEFMPEAHGRKVNERKSYFLWGLAPTKVVDVSEKCPEGIVAIRDNMSFLDGLFGTPFLGIWTFRSSTYYCRAEAGGGLQ